MATIKIQLDNEQLTIQRRFINEARKRAQNEAWMWRYHTGNPTPGWRNHAACKGMNPDWFYNDDGDKAKLPTHVLEVCEQCPVRLDCGKACAQEEHITDINVIHGIRAGMTAQTRWRLYRRMNRIGIRG